MKKYISLSFSIILVIIIITSFSSCADNYIYYDISFNLDGGELAGDFNEIEIDSSGNITSFIPSPYKDGYDFIDWYLNENHTLALTADNLAKIEADIILYAKWVPYPIYNVDFVFDNELIKTKEYERGSTIDYYNPLIPLYIFEDWYKDTNLINKWDAYYDTVQGNMTLYAKCEFGFDYTVDNNKVTIIGFKDNYYDVPEVVNIPSSIDDMIVIGIAEEAFYNDINMLEVTIPSTIDYIGKRAFMFSILEKATFSPHSNLLALPENIFYGCDRLVEVSLPTELMVIGNSAFQYCSNLSIISMPYNLNHIGFGAFQYCESLTNLDFGTNPVINEIGNQAFAHCTSLTELIIPSTIERIGDSAFSNCTSVSSLTFNLYIDDDWGPYSNLKYLGYNAFNNIAIESVILPMGIEEMGSQIFNNCENLTIIKCMESEKPAQWSNSWNYNPDFEGGGYYFDVEWGFSP